MTTVALFTGAWIETFTPVHKSQNAAVALSTGAWIETR